MYTLAKWANNQFSVFEIHNIFGQLKCNLIHFTNFPAQATPLFWELVNK